MVANMWKQHEIQAEIDYGAYQHAEKHGTCTRETNHYAVPHKSHHTDNGDTHGPTLIFTGPVS